MRKKYHNHFYIILNSYPGNDKKVNSISGGDKITIEIIKKWHKNFKHFTVLTTSGGKYLINNYLKNKFKINFCLLKPPNFIYRSLAVLYFYNIVHGIKRSLRYRKSNTIYFSSSDFLPDVIPAIFGKMLNKNSKWIAAFYFFASSPFSKEFPYKGTSQVFRGIMYYLTQKISYFLIIKFADFLILCNEIDKKKFLKDKFSKNKIHYIYGGVDLKAPLSIKNKEKKYDAVFMARLHPQKGPIITLQAWKKVMQKIPTAKLCIIGAGQLESFVKEYISKNLLHKNIDFVGFKDGVNKFKILKSSKIFLHSAIYETGGIAAAEAMSAGLPVIAFDHPGYKYSFPKGLHKVAPIGDVDNFAKAIVKILNDEKFYLKFKKEAEKYIVEWSWDNRVKSLEHKLKKQKLISYKNYEA